MENKDTNPSDEIRMPELQIHGACEKMISFITNIRHLYWLISIFILLALFFTLMPHHRWKEFWLALYAQKGIVGLVLVFSLVAVSLVWSTFQRIDVLVLTFFNTHGKRSPLLDWLMLGFSQIGNGAFAMSLAFILFFSDGHLLAYELALGTLTLWLVVELMKVLFHRTRPYIKLKTVRIVGSRARGRSFPSGHTSQAFFLATLVLNYCSVGLCIAPLMYAVASLVGVTRIYVGMHYPRDVLGGAVLGTSWGLLGVVVNSYIRTMA